MRIYSYETKCDEFEVAWDKGWIRLAIENGYEGGMICLSIKQAQEMVEKLQAQLNEYAETK